jgi:hypothetical protein
MFAPLALMQATEQSRSLAQSALPHARTVRASGRPRQLKR